jgi:phosphate-selective porin OprO/OprP
MQCKTTPKRGDRRFLSPPAGPLAEPERLSQVVYQNFEHPGAGKYYDGFSIKRARLDFQGHFSSQFDYRVLVDFVGQSGANGTAPTGGQLISPFLVEAYIVYKPFTWLNFKAGQMIVEFGPENMTQDRNLDLIERSQVVNALVARKGDAANGLVDSIGNQNGRDIGIQLNGSLVKIEGLSPAGLLCPAAGRRRDQYAR